MIAFHCYMLNGKKEVFYAYKFVEQDGDVAIFDIGLNQLYRKSGVDYVLEELIKTERKNGRRK